MKPLSTVATLLLLGTVVAACCEMDSTVVLGLLLTAAVGWLAGHLWYLNCLDSRYLAFVES